MRLSPRAARDRIVGLERLSNGDMVLAADVRALPEHGAANEALSTLLAKAMGVAKSHVAVVSGHTARLKIVRVEGDQDRLRAALAVWNIRID